MDRDEKDEMIERYRHRLLEKGYSPEALGWNKRKHRLRYEMLLSYWQLEANGGLEVLDFGCGFGDMHLHCLQRGYDVRYTGIDINSHLVDVGRQVNPETNLKVRDAESEGLGGTFDIIVASGVHNARLRDNWGFVEWTFSSFFQHGRIGFALNFLSDRVNSRNEGNYYASPERVLELALGYSRRVVLRHDAMPFEFTVIVDKRDSFDERTVFSGFDTLLE